MQASSIDVADIFYYNLNIKMNNYLNSPIDHCLVHDRITAMMSSFASITA